MSSEQLEDRLKEFCDTFFGSEFKWRKGQREAVVEIVNGYYNNVKTVILDAPVGSGNNNLN